MALVTLAQPRPTLGIADVRILAMLLGCVVAGWAWLEAPRATLGMQAAMLVVATLLLLVTSWQPDRKAGGAAFLYFAVLGLFHFGLLLAVAIDGQAALIGQGDNGWVEPSRTGPAVALTALGIASAGVGVTVARGRRRTPLEASPAIGDAQREPAIGPVGVGTALLGLAATGAAVTTGGVDLLGAGYIEFLDSVQGSGIFSYGVLLLGLGLALMAAHGGRFRVAAWLGLAGLALVALPIGLRGPVIFPALALVMVEARRRPLRLLAFGVASIVALTMISLLRQTRLDGLAGILDGGWTRVQPIDGAAEMGYSLYPVVVVDEWMRSGSEPWFGQTLVAPQLRFVESVLGVPMPPDALDFRLLNLEVAARVGPIGGSPIAEGHRNLPILGVVLLMLLLGAILARLDALPETRLGTAIAAVVFLPLVSTVRNSFAPTLTQIVLGLALVGVAVLLSRRRSGAVR